MDAELKQIYYTFSEQEKRLKEAMKEVIRQREVYEKAKKEGKLKIDQMQSGPRLFDV